MLKTALIAVALLGSAPALAQDNARFVGPRVEVSAGFDDLQHRRDLQDVSYGLALGGDVALGSRVTIGAEASVRNVFNNNGREIGAAARLGYAFNDNVLAYGRVGYSNIDARNSDLDGLELGAGVSYALSNHVYTSVEYRHTEYDSNVRTHGARIGLGLRF